MSLRHRSYDVLPALSVRKAELRRSLRLVTAAWGLGIVWMTCISGSWMNTFQRMLGFQDRHFGLMRALPFIATFGNLAATIIIERSGLRKYFFMVTVGISRLLWLVVAAIVVLAPPGPVAVWSVIIVVLAAWTLSALGMPAWFVWMGDLIPRRIRGRYLANRQQITRLMQFPVAIALAIAMDRAIDDSLPFTPQAQPHVMWALCGLFVAAGVFGFADIMFFVRIREVIPTTPDEPRRPAVEIRVAPSSVRGPVGWLSFAIRYLLGVADELLLRPLKDRVFRRYVLFGATAMFAMAAGGPFYIRNMRENLGFSHLAVNVTFMVLGPLMAVLAVKQYGKLIDRWGRRPVLILATSLAVFGVVPYFFASKYTPNPQFVSDGINAAASGLGRALGWVASKAGLTVAWGHWQVVPPGAPVGAWLICSMTIFFGFVGWTGVMLAQQGIILGFADGHGRSKYVAAHAVLIGVGGVLGGIAGGLLADYIGNASWYHPLRVGPFEWNHWHATFLLSMLARMAAVGWAIGMPDPGARRARDMVRTVGIEMYNLVAGNMVRTLSILRLLGPALRRNGRNGGSGTDGGPRRPSGGG